MFLLVARGKSLWGIFITFTFLFYKYNRRKVARPLYLSRTTCSAFASIFLIRPDHFAFGKWKQNTAAFITAKD